jgi:putative ABC transport system permease protein
MIKHFFFSSIRNVRKHSAFTFINVAGLTIGLAVTMLIGLFIIDETDFDKTAPDSDRTYRLYYEVKDKDGKSLVATTPPTFAPALKNFPEVESVTRTLQIKSPLLMSVDSKRIYQNNGFFADANFFQVLHFDFIYGAPRLALANTTSMVISSKTAATFFGTNDPVGKQIVIGKDPYTVTGVFKSNSHSHLAVDYIIPLAGFGITEERLADWGWYGFTNYVKVNKGVNVAALEKKFAKFTNPILNKSTESNFTPRLQAVTDIHLYSAEFKYDPSIRGNIVYINALIAIAAFILLIACFNFINLATARSLERAKEVGVRKSIGASRLQLIIQFISESFILTLISVIIAITLVYMLLPWLNHFTQKEIDFHLFSDLKMLTIIIALTIVVSLLAGIYPALVISKFQPVKVLKGNFSGETTPGAIPWLRHSLIIIQFTLAVILMISSIIVIKQVNFMMNKDLGFNKEQVMLFTMRGDRLYNEQSALKSELLKSPAIAGVSIGYGFPGDRSGDGDVFVNGSNAGKKSLLLMVDHGYIPTLGLQVITGRNFSEKHVSDVDHAFIINETAVIEFGLGSPEKAIGAKVAWPTWRNHDSLKSGTVIGVVKDFHFKSLHEKIEPTVLQIYPPAYSKVAVKIKTASMKSAVTHISDIWNRFAPEYPFEYTFIDDDFKKMYTTETKLKSLLSVFTGLAVFIACLGLFGLSAFIAQRRKKEIAIRKVLGASVQNLVYLVSADLVKLVIVSLLVASPLAWYIIHHWLDGFTYRLPIDVWVFIIAAAIAITVAVFTVGTNAYKAARSKVVKNLHPQ